MSDVILLLLLLFFFSGKPSQKERVKQTNASRGSSNTSQSNILNCVYIELLRADIMYFTIHC